MKSCVTSPMDDLALFYSSLNCVKSLYMYHYIVYIYIYILCEVILISNVQLLLFLCFLSDGQYMCNISAKKSDNQEVTQYDNGEEI